MQMPKDIMAAAIRSLMVPEHEMATSVARALLAEREATEARTIERCAKVALTFAPATQDTWSDAIAEKCEEIAAAIRSQGKE